ncbi:MAG: hypothetical protein L3J67_05860 [Hyphomicrobiaceae bacterium]|nr:hypothetical protein [Hyphomicrobiaceae bacterium]
MVDIATTADGAPVQNGNGKSIKLYSYSQLFYFWPVWVTCLTLGGVLTYVEEPPLENYYGLIFVGVLIYTITATSINIRGLWFLLLTAVLVILSLVSVMLKVDDEILMYILELKLNANAGLYLTIGTVLAALWSATTFVYDRLRYVKVRRGRIQVVRSTGEGIRDYDTFGMTMSKKRDNFAQHWILGLGSADIVIRPKDNDPICIPNVLRSGSKLAQIEELLDR